MGKRLSRKQQIKKLDRKCQICKEDDYNLLDAHRIKPGAEGGIYSDNNTTTLCCKCHRKVHSGQIVIEGKYQSTKGMVLHYFINGEEFWG